MTHDWEYMKFTGKEICADCGAWATPQNYYMDNCPGSGPAKKPVALKCTSDKVETTEEDAMR